MGEDQSIIAADDTSLMLAAEHLAKFYVGRDGWNYEETQEAKRVERGDYEDDSEGMVHFLEAEVNGGSFVIQQWGLNGEEEESVLIQPETEQARGAHSPTSSLY